MSILVECLAMCFILLIICVVGIANGSVGAVYFYEPEVQEKEQFFKFNQFRYEILVIPRIEFVIYEVE